jgi:hypothetical protein
MSRVFERTWDKAPAAVVVVSVTVLVLVPLRTSVVNSLG